MLRSGLPGYYPALGSENLEYVKCVNPGACIGEKSGSTQSDGASDSFSARGFVLAETNGTSGCAPGFTGVMCAECEVGAGASQSSATCMFWRFFVSNIFASSSIAVRTPTFGCERCPDPAVNKAILAVNSSTVSRVNHWDQSSLSL